MPNHVTTRCVVTGSRADIKRFKARAFRVDDAKQKIFDFEAFIPMPTRIAKAQDDSWYNWSIRNWGTKWNSYWLSMVTDLPTMLDFCFATAWDFPLPVFRKIAKEFPRLVFRTSCYDEGQIFAGDGYFNGRSGQPKFARCEATDELYELVYGVAPDDDW